MYSIKGMLRKNNTDETSEIPTGAALKSSSVNALVESGGTEKAFLCMPLQSALHCYLLDFKYQITLQYWINKQATYGYPAEIAFYILASPAS